MLSQPVGAAWVGSGDVPCPPPSQPPAQQPPPVQRVRLRYAKRGRMRFTSHRDIARAFERAVRRAGLPVAYSSGFNPHPRLSYAGAAPTGAASEAEYVEVALAERCDPEVVRTDLDTAMPHGLDVVDAVVARPGSLAERLQASHWRVRLGGVGVDAAQSAVRAFLAVGSVEVRRMTKRGLRTFDARAAVTWLEASAEPSERGLRDPRSDSGLGGTGADRGGGHDAAGGVPPAASAGVPGAGCAILHMVVRHGEPSVRPDDVLAGLREIAGLEVTVAPVVQRLAQGPFDPRDGTVGDPLAFDRDTRDA